MGEKHEKLLLATCAILAFGAAQAEKMNVDIFLGFTGPIVMNTQEELRQAIKDLNDGSFIQERAVGI